MTNHWKAVFGVILVFIFGCLFGALGTSVFFYHRTTEFLQRGPEGVAELLERRMTHNLALDANQRQQIHAYFMENVGQRKQLQFQIQPQIQMLNRQTLQQINAVLRPDQRELFRENLTQFRQRFGKSPFNPNAGNQSAAPLGPTPSNPDSSILPPPSPSH